LYIIGHNQLSFHGKNEIPARPDNQVGYYMLIVLCEVLALQATYEERKEEELRRKWVSMLSVT
jgi:hypothetical protein